MLLVGPPEGADADGGGVRGTVMGSDVEVVPEDEDGLARRAIV